jgi:hypothetical protein
MRSILLYDIKYNNANFTSYLIHRNKNCELLRVLSIVPKLQNAQK